MSDLKIALFGIVLFVAASAQLIGFMIGTIDVTSGRGCAYSTIAHYLVLPGYGLGCELLRPRFNQRKEER